MKKKKKIKPVLIPLLFGLCGPCCGETGHQDNKVFDHGYV